LKKKLFFVSLAVALVTAGVTVGIMYVLVGDNDDDDYEYGKRFRYEQMTDKLADNLDIEKERVEFAVKKAAEERRQDALQGKLDSLVDKGTLSREEADAYMDWYKDKPDVPLPGPGLRGFKGREYAKPDGPSLRRGPETFVLPFGRGQFRGGPLRDGPLGGGLPPAFGIAPDGPSFWFRYDRDGLSLDGEVCLFLEDTLGEWGEKICDDDYYKFDYDDYDYDADDRDDDRDDYGHDSDDRDDD